MAEMGHTGIWTDWPVLFKGIIHSWQTQKDLVQAWKLRVSSPFSCRQRPAWSSNKTGKRITTVTRSHMLVCPKFGVPPTQRENHCCSKLFPFKLLWGGIPQFYTSPFKFKQLVAHSRWLVRNARKDSLSAAADGWSPFGEVQGPFTIIPSTSEVHSSKPWPVALGHLTCQFWCHLWRVVASAKINMFKPQM